MPKIVTYMMIMTAVLAILSIMGITQGPTSLILGAIGWSNLSGAATSSLFNKVVLIFGVVAVAGSIVAGFISSSSIQSIIISGLCSFLLAIGVGDMISIYTTFNTTILGAFAFIGIIVKLLIAVLLVGFFVSLVQFWFGNDI